MSTFSHLDAEGAARMVDIGEKPATTRIARAQARVLLSPNTCIAVRDQTLPKGDVLATARLAGIMAAKRTSELIPLCHPIALTHAAVDLQLQEWGILITATMKTLGSTGVEMEAMTAASVAALTLYDMLKSIERGICIEHIGLISKEGGVNGPWQRRT